MKKLLSLLLTVSLCLSGAVISADAGAIGNRFLYGDMNYDEVVAIEDVTSVQRYLAEMVTWDYFQRLCADYNHDDIVNVKDVTAMQRAVAELPQPESYGGYFWNSVHLISDCYTDYLSGAMPAGTPVTFTVQSFTADAYVFLVNGAVVRQRSADNTFTTAFTEPGYYNVVAYAFAGDGSNGDRELQGCSMEYTVPENVSADDLRINRFRLIRPTSDNMVYTVSMGAAGGTGPYTYSLKLEVSPDYYWLFPEFGLTIDDPDRFSAYCANHETDWQTAYDADNNEYYVRDFAADDVLTIDCEMLNFWDIAHVLTIQAKDANGVLSPPLRIDIQELNVAGAA